jgi:hypothetical protein
MATLAFATAAIAATPLLIAASGPSPLGQTQPGLWEISGMPGASAPIRQCITDMALLARFEHRARVCNATVLREGASSTMVEYNCGGAGFGHTEVQLITPRSLRISTQGISDGLPFNYVLQARRVDDCVKNASLTRH